MSMVPGVPCNQYRTASWDRRFVFCPNVSGMDWGVGRVRTLRAYLDWHCGVSHDWPRAKLDDGRNW
jgi:hypothetical protein